MRLYPLRLREDSERNLRHRIKTLGFSSYILGILSLVDLLCNDLVSRWLNLNGEIKLELLKVDGVDNGNSGSLVSATLLYDFVCF